MKILIVDDNPDDRTLAIRELEKGLGKIEVFEVASEKELEEALKDFDFDVVITDYRLRWGTGFDVLKKVRRVYPYTPVIMLTFTGREEIAVEAIKLGFDDYVLKSRKHMIRLPIAVKSAIEKKKREKELDESRKRLEESERKYRELWENANDILYVYDLNGKFIDANKMAIKIFGYGWEDVGKVGIRDVVVEEYQDIVFDNIKKIVETGKPIDESYEVLCKTKNGKKVWLEIRSRPIIRDGKVVAIQGIARDITKRKEYEEEIKRLNELLRLVNIINELMVKESDIDDLVKKTVEKLSEMYTSCIIAVSVNDQMVYYTTHGEIEDSGCMRKALESKDTIYLSPGDHIKNCKYIELHGNYYAIAIPMVVDEIVKGILLIHSEREFLDDEKEIIKTLAADLAFAINARQIEEQKWIAYEQIERNIEQYAILVDQIRNPLAAISLIAEMEVEDEVKEKILTQANRIEELISLLDKGWLDSEYIRNFLKKSWER